ANRIEACHGFFSTASGSDRREPSPFGTFRRAWPCAVRRRWRHAFPRADDLGEVRDHVAARPPPRRSGNAEGRAGGWRACAGAGTRGAGRTDEADAVGRQPAEVPAMAFPRETG